MMELPVNNRSSLEAREQRGGGNVGSEMDETPMSGANHDELASHL